MKPRVRKDQESPVTTPDELSSGRSSAEIQSPKSPSSPPLSPTEEKRGRTKEKFTKEDKEKVLASIKEGDAKLKAGDAKWKVKESAKFYKAKEHEVTTYSALLETKIKGKENFNLAEDGRTLMRFLSSPSELVRTEREKKLDEKKNERTIYRAKEKLINDSRLAYLVENIPDVIFIPGNNDLTQIDDAMLLLFQLKKELNRMRAEESDVGKQQEIENKMNKINKTSLVFSGLGGHGVAPGPIFASSEAAAMGHHTELYLRKKLEEKGMNNPIKLEEKATNTGQNVAYTEGYMKEIEKEIKKESKEYKGLNIWIIPTPVGGLRQMATVSQQAEPAYQVAKIYMLPSQENLIQENYFTKVSNEDASINLFAALRETVNHLGYMLENDFMSPHAPNKERMQGALNTVMKYYEVLTGEKLTQKAKEVLVKKFIEFASGKEKAGGMIWLTTEDQELRKQIKSMFDPIKAYFQTAFAQIERQHMEQLSERGIQPTDLNAQRNATRQFGLFIKNHPLDLAQAAPVQKDKKPKAGK